MWLVVASLLVCLMAGGPARAELPAVQRNPVDVRSSAQAGPDGFTPSDGRLDSAEGSQRWADLTAARISQGVSAPGAAWVVVEGDHIASGARGSTADGDTISPDSSFLWGSVSKPVAGLVAARLACRGELDLGAKVVQVLPTFRPADPRANRITVGQLLDHTSGVGPLLDQLDDGSRQRPWSTALAKVAAVDLLSEPGSRHHYSSANYLLLAAVLEQVTGTGYPDLVAGELAARDTSAVVTRPAPSELVGGHRYLFGHPTRLPERYDDLGLAYGYLAGSATQLANLGRAVNTDLDGPENDCSPTVLATTASARTADGGGYGLGWRVGEWNGETVLWHTGAVEGYTSFLAVVPGRDRVIVVLQDAYGPLHDELLIAPGLAALANNSLANDTPADGPAAEAGKARAAGIPTAYLAMLGALIGCLAALAFLLRRPATRAGRAARVVLGVLLAAGAAALPPLTSAGSWRVLFTWLPDAAGLAALTGVLAALVALRGLAAADRQP